MPRSWNGSHIPGRRVDVDWSGKFSYCQRLADIFRKSIRNRRIQQQNRSGIVQNKSPNWYLLLTTILNKLNSYVSQIQYSYTPRLEINLESYLDKQTLTDAISKIEYINGGTNTAAALTYAQKLGFSYDGGARLTAPKVGRIFENR